ncbi:MAG: RNA-binding S4 domain-containing protein [Hyphomicrobiaceae bacterium]
MADDHANHSRLSAGAQRLDKWLWFARVIRTRTLAAGLVTDGRVRVNRERIVKPSQSVKPGDVITVSVGAHVRVLEIVAAGNRRGPPAEAQALYRDLTPPKSVDAAATEMADGGRIQGTGRPTKRDRRALDRLREAED